jgi:hypothetical protein
MRQFPASVLLARRQFVATLTGVPLGLAATHALGVQAVPDPIAQELLTETLSALNDSGRDPAGSARRQARILRLMAAVTQKEGGDRLMRDVIRRERERGEDILFEHFDVQATARELRRRGVTIDMSHLKSTPVDPERKRKALDRLEREGGVATLKQAARAFDEIAPRLEPLRPVRHDKLQQRCLELNDTLYMLESYAAMWCLMWVWMPLAGPFCFAAGTAAIAYRIYIGSLGECT